MTRRVLGLCIAIAVLLPGSAAAQVRPEVRGEFVDAAHNRAEVGGGLSVPLGSYLRVSGIGTRDVWSDSDTSSGQWRGEFQMRFLMDPLAEHRFGVSMGAGLGYRERPYMVAVVDVEGRPTRVRPALSVSLGGGLRFALVLRAGRRGRR
jgi:hypothetical protein